MKPNKKEILQTVSDFCKIDKEVLNSIHRTDAYGLIIYNIIKRIEQMENINKLEQDEIQYTKASNLDLQVDNHETFDVPNLTLDEDINVDRRILRLALAFEELTELASAFGCEGSFADICSMYTNKGKRFDTHDLNKVEVLDALCDIEVINNGTILESGLGENYHKAYLQTHNNNMNKAHDLLCEAEKTIQYYEKEKGLTGLTIKEKNGKYIVYRSDGKYLKPYYHKANNLSDFVLVKK